MARRRRRWWMPQWLAMHIIFGHERYWPTWRRIFAAVFGPRIAAQIRVDPRTGSATTRGMRLGEDGRWQLDGSRRKVTHPRR